MKNKTIGKVMAMALAMAVVAGSPMGMLEAHAYDMPDVNDGCAHSTKEPGGSSESDGSDDINAGPSENTYVEEAPSYSYEEPSYEEPSYEPSESVSYEASSNESSSNESYNAATSSTSSTSAAPAARYTGGMTKAAVPGYETWRQSSRAAAGTYTVTHCGVAQYVAQLKDADGNDVAYASAGLKEIDKKWYINIVTAAGVDTTGYTVATGGGSESYLTKLGIAGVTLNDVVAVDPAAAAAETAAK